MSKHTHRSFTSWNSNRKERSYSPLQCCSIRCSMSLWRIDVTASELTHSSSCRLELQTQIHKLKNIYLSIISWIHSQYVTQLLQLLQGLLTPTLLCRDPAALTDPSLLVFWNLWWILCCSLLAHIDREGSVVKLQHSLLENRGGGEKE